MTIYTGNISFTMTEEELEKVFAEYGTVTSAKIIRNKFNGRSKGFGFVDMENDADGEAAIEALDGTEVSGRNLKVNKAHPRREE